MKKIRLGNTIDIVWEIFLGKDKDKGKYDLTGKKLTIYLVSAFDRIKISDFTTEFNVLRFTFEGKDQKHAGRYQMTFVENEGGDDTRTLDKCDAFELVRGSCMETDDLSEITLASSFDALRIYPIIPQVGPNRNWWVDGVDTGKSSVGLTAYEFAKEFGYEGTEEEYAAECLAVPVLNEESRTATEEARTATEEARTATEETIAVAEGAKSQLQSASDFMSNVAVPTITRAELAAEYAEQAKQEADAATAAATEAAAAAESAISNIAPILNEKQDKLVSGENIKTLNGQSLLGEGDVDTGMTHVTDFTVEDLSNLYNGSSDPKQCDLLRLQNSLANKEIILVPYGPEEVKGYSLLHGYSDDLLYFSVTDERGNIYSVETDKNAREIYSENITFISPVTNQANIADLKKKDTQTDAKLTELSERIDGIGEGAVGPQGPQGEQGEKGADGKSAYDLWIEAGNEGSSEDFLESLKGEQGPKGDQGEQGIQGDKGDIGPKGDKGDKGDGVAFAVTVVTSESKMTDITKLYALNGEIYRFEGAEGVNEVAAVAVAAEGGEVPLFTNIYVKEEAEINKRVATSSFKDQTGGLLTNYMDIPMGHGVENPIVRIKGLPHPETFGTHDLDRIVCLKDGAEYKQNGNWVMYYCKEGLNNGYYTKEVLEDGTLVLTMKAGGFPAIWGAQSANTYQPRIAFDNVNGDASALTEAPDLIITLNEEIKYGTPEEPSEPTNKGRWVNTHIKYDADASQMILDNLAELQGYAEIPSYWESEMVDTIEKVQRLKKAAGNNAISFAWCSDAHVMVNTSAEGNTTYLGRLLNKAIKDTFTPLAISTGDEMHGAALASEDVVYENFAEMKKHFYPMWGKKEFIALLGNHDGAYGKNDQGGQTYQKRIQPNELFDVYFKEQMLDFRRVVSTDGTYFYIDTPQKVRFICLNTHYAGESVEVDENGFTKVNVYNNNYLGQQQYDWLINEALKMPSDEWSCIVAGHIAPVLGSNLTIPSGSNPAYNYSSSLKDKEVLAGVLNAFIAKSAYTKSYSDANGVGDVSIDCDFSTYKGTMICYIAGHWHCDLTENKSLNGVPIILITSAQDDRDSSLPAREDGTDTETAFDVVVVNRKTKKIQCVRCGAGEDRTISY